MYVKITLILIIAKPSYIEIKQHNHVKKRKEQSIGHDGADEDLELFLEHERQVQEEILGNPVSHPIVGFVSKDVDSISKKNIANVINNKIISQTVDTGSLERNKIHTKQKPLASARKNTTRDLQSRLPELHSSADRRNSHKLYQTTEFEDLDDEDPLPLPHQIPHFLKTVER